MATITVDDGAGTDIPFVETLAAKAGSREFIVAADAIGVGKKIIWSIVNRTKPGVGVERRRLYIAQNVADTITGVIHTGSLTCEWVLPPTDDFTLSTQKTLISIAIAIMARNSAGAVDYANVQALMAGVLPEGDLAA